MTDQVLKYRLKTANDTFESLKQMKDLGGIWLPTVSNTLKEWKKIYNEYMPMRPNVNRLDEQPIIVIEDIQRYIENLIQSRILHGYGLMNEQIEEYKQEIKELNRLLDKDKDERDHLNRVIKEQEGLVKEMKKVVGLKEPKTEEDKKNEETKEEKPSPPSKPVVPNRSQKPK